MQQAMADQRKQRVLDVDDVTKATTTVINGLQLVPIMTFTSIISSLPRVPGIEDWAGHAFIALTHADRVLQKGPDIYGLTRDMIAAIHVYTQQGLYDVLNAVLRDTNRANAKPFFPFLKLFLTALSKLPSVERALWRGVARDIAKDYASGTKFIWWAISSFTIDGEALNNPMFLDAGSKSVLFCLETPHWGKDICRYSAFGEESEVCVACGMVGVVQTSISAGDAVTVIHVKQDMKESSNMIDFDFAGEVDVTPLPEAPKEVVLKLEMPMAGEGIQGERRFIIKETGEFITADYIVDTGLAKDKFEKVAEAAERARGELEELKVEIGYKKEEFMNAFENNKQCGGRVNGSNEKVQAAINNEFQRIIDKVVASRDRMLSEAQGCTAKRLAAVKAQRAELLEAIVEQDLILMEIDEAKEKDDATVVLIRNHIETSRKKSSSSVSLDPAASTFLQRVFGTWAPFGTTRTGHQHEHPKKLEPAEHDHELLKEFFPYSAQDCLRDHLRQECLVALEGEFDLFLVCRICRMECEGGWSFRHVGR